LLYKEQTLGIASLNPSYNIFKLLFPCLDYCNGSVNSR
jgi:hypothetical protein